MGATTNRPTNLQTTQTNKSTKTSYTNVGLAAGATAVAVGVATNNTSTGLKVGGGLLLGGAVLDAFTQDSSTVGSTTKSSSTNLLNIGVGAAAGAGIGAIAGNAATGAVIGGALGYDTKTGLGAAAGAGVSALFGGNSTTGAVIGGLGTALLTSNSSGGNNLLSTATGAIGGLASTAIGGVSSLFSGFGAGNTAQLIDILLTTGQKTETKSMKYKITLTFPKSDDANEYNDVTYYTARKLGLMTSAPIHQIEINLPPLAAQRVKKALDKDQYLDSCKIRIDLMDSENENKVKSKVFESDMIIISLKFASDMKPEKTTTTLVDMKMIHPVIFSMRLKYSYNKIHNTKTPLEVLEDYEGYIKSTYGDVFDFKHFISNKNDHKYEQILTKPTNEVFNSEGHTVSYKMQHDIDVPLFLQKKYKIDNAMAFYLFDDFKSPLFSLY